MTKEIEMPEDEWSQYQRLVLAELERHNVMLEEIRRELQQLHMDVAILKTKAIILGAVAGGVISIVGAIILKYL